MCRWISTGSSHLEGNLKIKSVNFKYDLKGLSGKKKKQARNWHLMMWRTITTRMKVLPVAQVSKVVCGRSIRAQYQTHCSIDYARTDGYLGIIMPEISSMRISFDTHVNKDE